MNNIEGLPIFILSLVLTAALNIAAYTLDKTAIFPFVSEIICILIAVAALIFANTRE